jgi:hypothetical protein
VDVLETEEEEDEAEGSRQQQQQQILAQKNRAIFASRDPTLERYQSIIGIPKIA